MDASVCAQCGAKIPIDHACVVTPSGRVWCGDVCAKKWEREQPIPPPVMPRILVTFIF